MSNEWNIYFRANQNTQRTFDWQIQTEYRRKIEYACNTESDVGSYSPSPLPLEKRGFCISVIYRFLSDILWHIISRHCIVSFCFVHLWSRRRNPRMGMKWHTRNALCVAWFCVVLRSIYELEHTKANQFDRLERSQFSRRYEENNLGTETVGTMSVHFLGNW